MNIQANRIFAATVVITSFQYLPLNLCLFSDDATETYFWYIWDAGILEYLISILISVFIYVYSVY